MGAGTQRWWVERSPDYFARDQRLRAEHQRLKWERHARIVDRMVRMTPPMDTTELDQFKEEADGLDRAIESALKPAPSWVENAAAFEHWNLGPMDAAAMLRDAEQLLGAPKGMHLFSCKHMPPDTVFCTPYVICCQLCANEGDTKEATP